ncbi:MAG: threonine dehydratase [Thermoleophilia bacterium]
MTSTTTVLDTDPAPRSVAAPSRADVHEAWRRIFRHLGPSPLVPSPQLGLGTLLKVETLQPTGSFKVRGALSALTLLPPDTEVVCASAGNHGLGVAHAASLLGLRARVVCPLRASPAKIEALRRLRASLVLHGETYDEAEEHALELARREGSRYVSPYNDTQVIAGQGTLGLELLRQVRPPFTVVCPIGGGGLAAGVALAVSAVPGVRVVGVECEASAAMRASLDAGRIVSVPVRATLADGLGGNLEPGTVTFALCQRYLADVAVVAEEEIEEAVRFLVRAHGLVVEGAGAVAVAALLAGRVQSEGKAVALVTGRNIDLRALARLL